MECRLSRRRDPLSPQLTGLASHLRPRPRHKQSSRMATVGHQQLTRTEPFVYWIQEVERARL
jgi:hypothetical protein